jgi:murein L,D-transpeptidase YafK
MDFEEPNPDEPIEPRAGAAEKVRRPRSRRRVVSLLLLFCATCILAGLLIQKRESLRRVPALIAVRIRERGQRRTVAQRIEEYGPVARQRLQPYFDASGLKYPPAKVVLVGIKDAERIQLYAAGATEETARFVREYPIVNASGTLGPKLKEGDQQVPEGIYGVESLNPNSLFHLSLRVNYPNAYDKARAREDGRRELGGDIMIHGGRASVGCLAMGDEVAEELFVLAADTGIQNVRVLLTPTDFRMHDLPERVRKGMPDWCDDLYGRLKAELIKLPQE